MFFEVAAGTTLEILLHDLNLTYKGTRSGAGALNLFLIHIQGGTVILDADKVYATVAMTNATNFGTAIFNLGTNAATILKGIIRRLVPRSIASDTGPRGVIIRATTTLTVDRLDIVDCDFSSMPGGTDVVFSDNTNKDKVFFRNNRWRVFPVAASAIAVTASPFTYQNLSGYQEKVMVVGGTVTAIEISNDGATWTNTGAIAGPVLIDNGQHVRVTYSVAPTMSRMPVK
jgi:hypothetical protein